MSYQWYVIALAFVQLYAFYLFLKEITVHINDKNSQAQILQECEVFVLGAMIYHNIH